MESRGHQGVKLFVGTEVEHTPAHNMRTLFVVGVQDVEEINFALNDQNAFTSPTKHIKHIYFGANQSFPKERADAETWRAWAKMIGFFLDLGYKCTLDVDVCHVNDLAETWLVEKNNFIPMISVKVPYARLLGYNATVKIDDVDYNATNSGVWCHSLHDLMDRSKFTDWSCYTKDEVLK